MQMREPVSGGRRRPSWNAAMLAVLPAFAWMPGAHAARWNFDNGWAVNFDSLVSAGVALRTSGRNCSFVGNDNGGCVGDAATPLQQSDPSSFSASVDTLRLNQDDGNLNYRPWQPVSANTQWTGDLAVKGGNGWSGLLRGVVNYDAAIARTQRTDLSPEAEDFAVSNPRLLDAFVSKEFDIGELPARLRVGNQVISWGESLYILGGINAINPIYVPGSHSAGTPLKTLFMPSPMVSLNTSLTDSLGIEAYYQWQWDAFDFDAPGTFFSTSDVLGDGGRGVYLNTGLFSAALSPAVLLGLPPELLPVPTSALMSGLLPPGTVGDPGTTIVGRDPRTLQPYNRPLSHEELADPQSNPLGPLLGTGTVIERGSDREPKDGRGGQGGIAFRYKFEESGNEVGFYYLRYHDKIPFGSYRVVETTSNPVGLELVLDYGRDRDLFGLSSNFLLGDWQLGAELSYRPNDGVPIDRSAVIDPENPYYCTNYSNSNLATPETAATDTPIGSYCRGWIDTDNYQLQVSGLNIVSPSGPWGWLLDITGAKESILLAEASVGYYPELEFNQGIPYASTANYELPTRSLVGAVLFGSLTFPNVFGTRATVIPDLTVSQGIHGYPATYLPGFVEGAGAATLGFNLDFKVKPATTLRLDATQFWGGGDANLQRDRDFLSLSVTVGF